MPIAQRRRAQRGSVLILVVALLVLLALIGTAWMSSVRIERYASNQNTSNVQIDLLVDGVKNIAQASIVDDLYGTDPTSGVRLFKPNDSSVVYSAATANYGNWDWPQVDPAPTNPPTANAPGPADRYIASRLPVKLNNGTVVWPTISVLPGLGDFESPLAVATGSTYSDHNFVEPASVLINGQNYPALRCNYNGTPSLGNNRVYLAGDTDGDGIADAGLYRLPIGEINGVTYYAAARIVDNGSAINFNTAWSSNFDWNGLGSTTLSSGYFPTGVGLIEMLKDYIPPSSVPLSTTNIGAISAEMNNLNNFRFDSANFATSVGSLGVVGTVATPTLSSPVQDGSPPVARPDFQYSSVGDAFTSQVARRVANVGSWNSSAFTSCQALSSGETSALAYHMLLSNRDASRSQVETLLLSTLTPNNLNKTYNSDAAIGVPAWSNDLDFDYWRDPMNSAGTFRPLRPLLVGTNGVGNSIALRSTAAMGSPPTLPAAEMAPYRLPAPPKANINTASFGELYRAFWSVMTEPGGTAPYPAGDQHMFRDPQRVPLGAAPGAGTALPPQLTSADMVQLRAAIAAVNALDLRDGDNDISSAKIALPNGSVAVVNGTEKQPFITEVFVDVYPGPELDIAGKPKVGGASNAQGFIAIELYNPYQQSLTLRNWRIGVIDRRQNPDSRGYTTQPQYPLTVRSLSRQHAPALTTAPPGIAANQSLPLTATNGVDPIVIPPGGHIVLTNQVQPGYPSPSDPTRDAQYVPLRARPITGVQYYVPNLQEVIESTTTPGGELVLLRPRRSDGVATIDAAGQWNEDFVSNPPATKALPADADVGGYLNDLVPLDAFDFTGLAQTPLVSASFPMWHYIRSNAPTSDLSWKFVYPGAYSTAPGAAGALARQEGVDERLFIKGLPLPVMSPRLATLGSLNTVASGYDHSFPGIQISNNDAPGAYGAPQYDATQTYGIGDSVCSVYNAKVHVFRAKIPVPANNVPAPNGNWEDLGVLTTPFGSFARNGDILQVPFIGSYVIRQAPALPAALPRGSFYEMTPITTDSAFARYTGNTSYAPITSMAWVSTSTDPAAPQEMLGRFCPMRDTAAAPTYDDFDPTLAYTVGRWRYRWATRLFDYLTVQAPSDDYFPNADPSVDPNYPAPANTAHYKYVPGNLGAHPVAVKNGSANASDAGIANQPGAGGAPGRLPSGPVGSEDSVAVEGLVNINTAPWYVLARLPLVLFTASGGTNFVAGEIPGTVDQDKTNQLAKFIVLWRDGDPTLTPVSNPYRLPHGPFRSIFDLCRVVEDNAVAPPMDTTYTAGSPKGFQNAWNTVLVNEAAYNLAHDPDTNQRDFSPAFPPPGSAVYQSDGVRKDFEDKFLAITRISNLITTRSDSFTIYVLVQGWRNVGTAAPELVTQRRVAFLADRSSLPVDNKPRVINIPN
jgi:hypothetical protein